MTRNEMEVTPAVEEEIRRGAARFGFDPELLRYYFQFGVDAPPPPQLSRRARRWLRRLGNFPIYFDPRRER